MLEPVYPAGPPARRCGPTTSFPDPTGPRLLSLALALAPPELTRREREVAMLAMTGLSSRAIANRLCLSVRTVDSHLARVYSKMGITGRSDLAKALTGVLEGVEAS